MGNAASSSTPEQELTIPTILTHRFCVSMARHMRSLTLFWLVYQLTNSPLALGVIGLAEAIPYISSVLSRSARSNRGLPQASSVLLNQIKAIDKDRLEERIGQFSEPVMQRVDDAIKMSLGLLPL